MKTVTLKNDKVISTPWLKPEEAAAYCGVSRAFFDKHGARLPHGGNNRTRLYHVEVIDAWINNELDVPFTEGKIQAKRKTPRGTRVRASDEVSITIPATGKRFTVGI